MSISSAANGFDRKLLHYLGARISPEHIRRYSHRARILSNTKLIEGIIRVECMASTFSVASAGSLWCTEARELNRRHFLTGPTRQVNFRPQRFLHFPGCLHPVVHQCRLPFVDVSAYGIYFSSYERDSVGVSTGFFENDQQVTGWL
ncbi:hypothetical protein LINGRAHAP2_LOCUS12228 [Linum grandiflorum]